MKTQIQIIITALLIIVNQNIFGQVTTPANTFGAGTDYLGWNTTPGTPPLRIKHELPLPINFYTNAGAAS